MIASDDIPSGREAVLDNLFVYVVLAVLILFQDDIRSVVASAAGSGWFDRERGGADATEGEEALGEVVGVEPRPWFRCPFAEGHDDVRVLGALRELPQVAELAQRCQRCR